LERPEGVPLDEHWALLPPDVLAAAADSVELFFPVLEADPRSIERLNALLIPVGGVLVSLDQVLSGVGS
jgi:hypothetical protein